MERNQSAGASGEAVDGEAVDGEAVDGEAVDGEAVDGEAVDGEAVDGEAVDDWGGLPLRRAGRVIVIDPGDRVLLLRYDQDPPTGRHWATPGGGLNPGESYAAAAARELAEETGWEDMTLLGEVHRHMRLILHEGRPFRQYERLFLARTGQECRPLGDVATMHAADGVAAWRWWTLGELDSTAELVWPTGLAALIRGTAHRP